jgi:hypothetical protein
MHFTPSVLAAMLLIAGASANAQGAAMLRPGELLAPSLPLTCVLPIFERPAGTTQRADTVALRFRIRESGAVVAVQNAFSRSTPFAELVATALAACSMPVQTSPYWKPDVTYLIHMYFPAGRPAPLVRQLVIARSCREKIAATLPGGPSDLQIGLSITPSGDTSLMIEVIKSSGDTRLDDLIANLLRQCEIEKAQDVYGNESNDAGRIVLLLPK